jgi:hypothetical protein
MKENDVSELVLKHFGQEFPIVFVPDDRMARQRITVRDFFPRDLLQIEPQPTGSPNGPIARPDRPVDSIPHDREITAHCRIMTIHR